MAEDWQLDQLLRDVRRCRLCSGLPLGPNPLLQCSASAQILIAGQAPGRRAHESGIPFDDPSGDRLRDWLGVTRTTFYDASKIAMLPMGFCYPGSGRHGDLPPRAECAMAWRNRLLAGLRNIRLTILIGIHAQRWHLGDRFAGTLGENVGNWRDFWPEAVVLPHPSPRNTRWLKKHPEVQETILPALKMRVQTLLASDALSA